MMLFNTKFNGQDLPKKDLWVRMDRAIRSSGLLAFLSAQDFQTFIALLTFVDESGRCDLSGRTLGQTLNLSEANAQRRLKKLCRVRWHGRPLVVRENGRETGRFLPTGYQVMEVEGVKVISGGASQTGKPKDSCSNVSRSSRAGSSSEGRTQDTDAKQHRGGEAGLRRQGSNWERPVASHEGKASGNARITGKGCVGVSNINNKHTTQIDDTVEERNKEVLGGLLSAGVSRSIASELLGKYPTERIVRQIQMLRYRNAKEPAAMLIKAIKEDWSAPAAYVARKREEADRKAKAEAEARAEQRREAWRKRVEEAKAKLPPVELERIIRTAKEKVSREMRGVLHGKAPERLVKAEVNKVIARKYLKHAGS